AAAVAIGGKVRNVDVPAHDLAFLRSSQGFTSWLTCCSVSLRLGQNQYTSAAATNTPPHTTAQGESMVPMNIADTANAVRNGATLGETSSSTWSGRASTRCVTRVERTSTGRPVTSPGASASHSGSREATTRWRTKL